MQNNFDSFLNGSASKEDVEKYVNNNLSHEDKEKIKSVLADKNKLNEILSSPFAQELMKKFRK